MPPPSLAIQTSPAWHIAMPSGGGIHPIKLEQDVKVLMSNDFPKNGAVRGM
jgi:hypothetical protein